MKGSKGESRGCCEKGDCLTVQGDQNRHPRRGFPIGPFSGRLLLILFEK